MQKELLLIFLLLSTILIAYLLIFVVLMKNKRQIHYAFSSVLLILFIWDFVVIYQLFFGYGTALEYLFEKLYFICVILVSVALLFIGMIFAHTRIEFTFKYLLIFIIPLVSILMVLTNDYHHLFYVKYSIINTEFVFGRYFIVHEMYSYFCILLGLYYLLYFTVKNSGFFSKQSILIFIGILIPFSVTILSTSGLVSIPISVENISFSFANICFALAILKFNFLNITPIAMQNIVDNISDGFIVTNEQQNIVDYNKTFIDIFGGVIKVKRNIPLLNIFADNIFSEDVKKEFNLVLEKVRYEKSSFNTDMHIKTEFFDKYFTIEITPIISRDYYLGTILLMKDITQHITNLERIKENQAILLEQERLASLGQLIGGIAHNLKTPIMSIAGGIEALKDLAFEYRDSIDDKSVTEQDHKEIARDMLVWLEKMKPYCAYMSDVISAVKGQAVQMNASNTVKFTVDELMKRVDLLLKHELKKYHCMLKINSHIDMSTEIKGEINNLVQVFDNIIINAMESYEGKTGTIDMAIVRSGDNIEFIFKDYGKGIPKNVADRLFKEMITTKGKNGTGLGLYMSYSTIKGRFGGNMSFTSKEGVGTTFLISIPCITYSNKEVG